MKPLFLQIPLTDAIKLPKEATWETEEDLRKKYPDLFTSQ